MEVRETPHICPHLSTKMLGVHCSGKISMQISWRMDLWERGSHSDLVGDTEAEGAAREERAFREEEKDVLVRRFLGMVLLGKRLTRTSNG